MAVEFQDFSLEVMDALEEAAIAYLHEAAGELEAQTIRNTRQGWRYRDKQATSL